MCSLLMCEYFYDVRISRYIINLADFCSRVKHMPNSMEVPIGSGSGYVWDSEGHIVTNFHVVQQAKSAQVAILTPSSMSTVNGNNLISTKSGGAVTNAINPFTSVRPGALGSSESSSLNGFTRNVYKARVVGVDPTKGKLSCTVLVASICWTAISHFSVYVTRYCGLKSRCAYE